MSYTTVSLGAVYIDGVKCKNPEILSWEALNDCTDINCKLENGQIKIQYVESEGCDKPCVRLVVKCNDGCSDCPTKVIETCLCETNDDCDGCDLCNENGFCFPKTCPTGLVLKEDGCTCVQCVGDVNCPCDQECVNNLCQCPPGKFINEKGCCVDCLTNDDCEDCEQCIGPNCVPVVCPDGVCDPNTDKCEECLISSDCEGDNVCCINKRCVCCPGFVKDSEGNCVPPPPCTKEEDCPKCFTCVGNNCVPIVCPDGKVCVDGECKDICDCAEPGCTKPGQFCVQFTPNICYCEECEGPCDDLSDCAPGCGCIQNNCVKQDCVGLCDEASDCGPGCGCSNGSCVKCSELTCGECATVVGCICVTGVCQDNPCSKACNTGDDCGPGCGCLEGECVPCSAIDCSTNIDCPNGCSCSGSGKCQDNPCVNTFCNSPDECGPGCGCVDGLCVPCSSLSCVGVQCDNAPGCECVNNACVDDNDPDCTDELKLEKIDSACDLEATLTTELCCLCDDIEVRVGLETEEGSATGTSDYNFTIGLYKNNVRLDNTGVTNELPNSGIVRLRARTTLLELDPVTEQPLPSGATIVQNSNVITNITNLAEISPSFLGLADSGVVLSIGSKKYRVIKREFRIDTIGSISFPNECSYRLLEKLVYNFSPPIPPSVIPTKSYTLARLVNCRRPLFTFYKSATSAGLLSPANVFKRVYADRINDNSYRHLLTNYPDLEYGKYFGLTTECGCDNDAVYSCFGNDTATPLVFCTPQPPLEYDIDNCDKDLTFTEDVVINCDVYLANGAPKPVYQLLLNGVVVDTRALGAHPANILYVAGAETFTSAQCITSVELRQVADICEQCNIRQDRTCTELDVQINSVVNSCGNVNSAELTFTITGGSPDYAYEVRSGSVVLASSPPDLGSEGMHTVTLNVSNYPGPQIILTVIDANGCEVERRVNFNKGAGGVSIFANGFCDNGVHKVAVTNNSQVQVTVNVFQGSPPGFAFLLNPNTTNTVTVPNGGTWTVTAVSTADPSCSAITSATVDCCNPNPFTNTNVYYDCVAGLVVTSGPSGATYTANGSPVLPGATLPNGSYVVVGTLGSCTRTFPAFTINCGGLECESELICTNLPAADMIATSVVITGTTYVYSGGGIPIFNSNDTPNQVFKDMTAIFLNQAGELPCGTGSGVFVFSSPRSMTILSGATTVTLNYNSGLAGSGSLVIDNSACLA
jgi:hypothetical protein